MRSLLGRFHRPMSRGAMGDMLTMNSLGDGSTLSLDFTTGVLDSRLTFTRSTTATYINSSGYVTSAAINAPRFDYSLTTIGEPRGLLIEGQIANACLNSQALTTGWLNVNMITPTNPAIADPFGGTSATWKLVAASGTAIHTWRHSVITLTAAAYTFSFWAKAVEYDRVIIADPGTGIGACTFLLTGNGTATVVGGTATNPQITPYPFGWYRCSVTMTTSATTYAFGIAGYPATGATIDNYGATYTGTGTEGVYATGLQIELGSGASSYIPTGASQVTRNADDCTITGTNFSSWYNPNEGSTLIQWTGGSGQNLTNGRSHTFLNSAQTQQIFEGSAYGLNVFLTTFQAQIGYGLGSLFSAAKVASAFKQADFATSVNGSNAVVQSSGTMPTLVDRVSIGSNYLNAATYKFVCIKQFKYFPTRLSDAQLKFLSTP